MKDSNIDLTFASLEPAKPLNDAQMCGSFYIIPANTISAILTTLQFDEYENVTNLRSQIATSNNGRGGTRYLPYAFTELGVAMLRNE